MVSIIVVFRGLAKLEKRTILERLIRGGEIHNSNNKIFMKDKSTAAYPVNDKRTINAWAMFDWANSSYALSDFGCYISDVF